MASSGEGSEVVVTGSRIARAEMEMAAPVAVVSAEAAADVAAPSEARRPAPGTSMPVPPRPTPRPQPEPQSGLLTAGEHDDLLNPELYARYVRNSRIDKQIGDLPVLDTNRLLTVEVRDRSGRAVPFADVELRCSDGNTISLATVADGTAVFFPELDRLSQRLSVRVPGESWRQVRLSGDDGGQTVRITTDRRAPRVQKLDLNLVVDVTGSMSDELRYLQSELTAIIGEIERRHRNLDIRVGFTFYRDTTDDFVTQTFAFDRDLGVARSRLGQQRANGGGDYPEAMHTALIRAANQNWRDDAVKTLLLVADAPPHNQHVGTTWLAAEHLRAERVHIVPVGASGVADLAEYVMRAMAASTQSRYTFLTDDSGIGNPHAPPAIDCYLVTRLDQLLRRVIDSQISGRRIEPDRGEIIRSVGEYDAGRCILPPDFQQQS